LPLLAIIATSVREVELLSLTKHGTRVSSVTESRQREPSDSGAFTAKSRGSQPGVHVPLEVHLPIWRGTFEVSNRRGKYIYISFISKYSKIWKLSTKNSVEFCYFTQPFVIRNIRSTCLSVEMLTVYMVRERLGTPGIKRSTYYILTNKKDIQATQQS